jgi:low affinity Fe/Cu permease
MYSPATARRIIPDDLEKHAGSDRDRRVESRHLEEGHLRPSLSAVGIGWRPCASRSSVPLQAPSLGARPSTTSFEAAYQRVSRLPFFLVCVAIVVAWLVSLPLWGDTKAWQVAIHTVASVITLLLVALLENAGRRSAEAAQEKLNVIAEALAALMTSHAVEDRKLEDAVTRLRDAVGLEERH